MRSAALFDRVDFLKRAFRPVVGVFVDIFFLREGAERILVRRVDLLAFLLEELDSFLFLGVIFRSIRIERLIGFSAELLLLRGLQLVPRLFDTVSTSKPST